MNHRLDAFDIGADMVIEIVEAVGPIDFAEVTHAEGWFGTESRTDARTMFLTDLVSDGAGEQGPTPEGNGAGPSVRP